MTPKAPYELFSRIPDPYAPEFVAGETAIAELAGYRSVRQFFDRNLPRVTTQSIVAPGVLSVFTEWGHYYQVSETILTHPNSAEAWGQASRVDGEIRRSAGLTRWERRKP